ncbi:alpha-tocopherol transfer protein-like [Chironomus tepperi]|uniref:alpha-tocopherol transfer protein-like n=1 Tax=Chironomus tepperi TaxID=113505 RepID=UPI00391FA5D3
MDEDEIFEDCQASETILPIDELKEWIKNHGKFPKNIPDVLLERFLKVCDNDLDQTKDLILLNYKLRSSAPNLFTNRDITTKEMQTACKVLRFCPMPKLTKDKKLITIGGFSDVDPRIFNYGDCIKMALMVFDTRFCSYDDPENSEIATGEIVIMDVKGLSFRHFWKVLRNLMTAKFYMQYLQEAAPIRISQINIVNPSPVIDKLFSFMKPFMKKETLEVLRFHTQGVETLLERVGLENLPVEYGGALHVDLKEVHQNFIKKIDNFRNYLIDDDNWKFSS